jgi:hypothetical protein
MGEPMMENDTLIAVSERPGKIAKRCRLSLRGTR